MRASAVAPAGQWAREHEIGCIVADFEQRHRRRCLLATDAGEVLLDLRQPARLRDGDGLVLDGGGIIRVVALAESLVEITAFDDRTLVRLAWHLGNRHLPVQVMRHTLRIRVDRVIEEMLEGLGATLTYVRAPFDPEPGAYEHG